MSELIKKEKDMKSKVRICADYSRKITRYHLSGTVQSDRGSNRSIHSRMGDYCGQTREGKYRDWTQEVQWSPFFTGAEKYAELRIAQLHLFDEVGGSHKAVDCLCRSEVGTRR